MHVDNHAVQLAVLRPLREHMVTGQLAMARRLQGMLARPSNPFTIQVHQPTMVSLTARHRCYTGRALTTLSAPTVPFAFPLWLSSLPPPLTQTM